VTSRTSKPSASKRGTSHWRELQSRIAIAHPGYVDQLITSLRSASRSNRFERMNSSRWVVGGIGLFTLLTGCALQTGETTTNGEEENVASASTEQALLGGWATGPFTWSQGQPPMVLESTGTHVCMLSRMSGHYAGTGEAVDVTTTADGNNWVLTGFSQQSGVSGEAICFPKSGFFSNSQARVFSRETVASSFSRGSGISQNSGGGCQTDQEGLAQGSDFGFIEGIQGEMAGSGEYGSVLQAPSGTTITFLRDEICTGGSHFTFGRFLRVMMPTATPAPAKWLNTLGIRGDFNAIPEFSIGGNRASDAVKMAPSALAMCAFTGIQGKFAGGGESVQIREEGSNWVMRTTKGSASNFVAASARCFARFQL
jgi:hypothetical protein